MEVNKSDAHPLAVTDTCFHSQKLILPMKEKEEESAWAKKEKPELDSWLWCFAYSLILR